MRSSRRLEKLSEDHHPGLVSERRLRGLPELPGASTQKPHFRKEEEVLIPLLVRREPVMGERPVLRRLIQLARIRGLVVSDSSSPWKKRACGACRSPPAGSADRPVSGTLR